VTVPAPETLGEFLARMRAKRLADGLPETLQDPAVLARIAGIVLGSPHAMTAPGWCQRCRRIRRVRVQAWVGNTAVGVCASCEQQQATERKGEH